MLVLASLLIPTLCFGRSGISAADLRKRVQDRIGALPWVPLAGYRLDGTFVYKETGEEIRYRAVYLRSGARWVTDFTSDDRSRNMRFAREGNSAWASSPELTADVDPGRLPYCAAYDFPTLYAEFLAMLEKGAQDPSFRLAENGSEIYVRGKLGNGAEATFRLNALDCFPRNVAVKSIPGNSSAWFFLTRRLDGSKSLESSEPSTSFELWFSDPVDGIGYRYPGRTDYVGEGGVVGSFFLEKGTAGIGVGALFNRPPLLPWAGEASFSPRAEPHRTSILTSESELPRLRLQLRNPPWSGWSRTNAVVSMWAGAARWLSVLFPEPPSLASLSAGTLIVLIGALVLVRRRRVQFRWKAPRFLLPSIAAGCVAVVIAGIASIQLHAPRTRSLLALHTAIRYAATGNVSYARVAGVLLRNFSKEAPAVGLEELARSCQNYSAAYDLVSPTLSRPQQVEIEGALFAYAEPLFGSLHGWRSNSAAVTLVSAGLGMVALASRNDAYLKAAREGLDRTFREQLTGGLHRQGPGFGSVVLNDAANLMWALKRSGYADYFAEPAFEQYIRSNLQLLSPVGTLPLFGETSLDQSAGFAHLLLKSANHVRAEIGRQCMSAFDSFSSYGRHSATGLKKVSSGLVQLRKLFFSDPYVLFEFEGEIPRADLAGSSVVVGEGEAAVLRSGTGPDALFLALNASRSVLSHARRDVLTFDLYGFRALLLHGAGFPGADESGQRNSDQTAASNSITFNETGQSPGRCSGVVADLLNQPVFDQVRVLADRIYESGQVQRDVIMVRPEGRHAGYFLLIDEVHTYAPDIKVASYLHGCGELAIGLNGLSRWVCAPFHPPALHSDAVTMTALPLASTAVRSSRGNLLFEDSSMNRPSAAMVVEWTGPRRFCTVLYPQAHQAPEPRIERPGNEGSGRINETDWVSLGDPDTRRTTGPLTHVSEYSVIRERGGAFPALLMVFGLECRAGDHAVTSTKPVSVSLDGLRGGIMNTRPDTRVEIRSSEIKAGDHFLLDANVVTATEAGVLSLSLTRTGEHSFVKQ